MKKILISVLIIVSLFCLSGCDKNSQNLENEKNISEIMYIENGLITISQNCLQDNYNLENGIVDWSSINEDFDVLKNSINVILIDFSSSHVPAEVILQLKNNFRDMENFINTNDFNSYFQKIIETYNLVSYSILDNISMNKEFKLEKKSKSDLLYIGYYIKLNNREECINYINSFKENYSNLETYKEYIENNSYKINKIFIEIQNLESEIERNNFENARADLEKLFEFF